MREFIRRFFLFAAIAGFLSGLGAQKAFAAHSGGGPFGLGIILGEPSGITFEYKLSHENAVDGGLAYSFGNYFIVYGDYQFRFPSGFGHSTPFVSQLTPYVGVGGVLGAGNNGNTRLAIRIPLGIEWQPSRPPIGVFVELTPGLAFLPSTNAIMMGGVGVRYFF